MEALANMAKESALERKIIRYAKSTGWIALKFTSPGKRGVPDRLFFRNGSVVFLEIKAPGRKPTVLQDWVIRELRGAGQVADWVDNFEDAQQILDENA